jgi:hypothetical protein
MISIDINTQRGMLPSVGGNLITGLVDLTCQTVMEVMTGVMGAVSTILNQVVI